MNNIFTSFESVDCSSFPVKQLWMSLPFGQLFIKVWAKCETPLISAKAEKKVLRISNSLIVASQRGEMTVVSTKTADAAILALSWR